MSLIKQICAASTMFLLALLLIVTGPASAQEKSAAGSVAGKWKMTSVTPDGDKLDWNLTVKQEDGKWTATISSPDGGEGPAKDFKVTDTKVHFQTPYQGQYYDIDLTLESDKLVGTWSGNGDSGKTTGEHLAS